MSCRVALSHSVRVDSFTLKKALASSPGFGRWPNEAKSREGEPGSHQSLVKATVGVFGALGRIKTFDVLAPAANSTIELVAALRSGESGNKRWSVMTVPCFESLHLND